MADGSGLELTALPVPGQRSRAQQRARHELRRIVTTSPAGTLATRAIAPALTASSGVRALHEIRFGRVRAVIPAAGRATRFAGSVTKTLAAGEIGRPLILRVLDVVAAFDPRPVVIVNAVTGPQIQDAVAADGVHHPVWVRQDEALGMGHAILQAEPEVGPEPASLLIAWADMGALRERAVFLSGAVHQALDSPFTLPTMWVRSPYVALDRDADGVPRAVRQSREGDPMPAIGEADCGVFWAQAPAVFGRIRELGRTRRSGELALLPLLSGFGPAERPPLAVRVAAGHDSQGVNTVDDLLLADQAWRAIAASERADLHAAASVAAARDILALSTLPTLDGPQFAHVAERLDATPEQLLSGLTPVKQRLLGPRVIPSVGARPS